MLIYRKNASFKQSFFRFLKYNRCVPGVSLKNMLLSKNPQFLPNQYENLPKKGTHEDHILTKFHNDWAKNVDFFI